MGMVREVVKMDGMSCTMCGASIGRTLKEKFPVRKVYASCAKGEVEFLAEREIRLEELKEAFAFSIYRPKSVTVEHRSQES